MNSQQSSTEAEVHHLLRLVSRSFYPYQSVLILETLLHHSVVYEEDLLKLTKLTKKAFRSFLTKLLEDRLIVAHTQKEEAVGMQIQYRWINRTYFYIHYIEAIDAIKWKVHCLVKQVKEEIGQLNKPQGYVCPTCHARYSLLDVPNLISEDMLRFECSVCGDTLIEDDSGLQAQQGQEKLERLMSELEPIIESLKKIDSMKVPDNNFESSLVKAIPPVSSSLATYTISSKASRKKKEEKSNAAKRAQATVHVSITADDEEIQRERQQREERNEKLRQNALPSWHQQSAVGQSATVGVVKKEDEPESKDSSSTISSGATATRIKKEAPPTGLSDESTAEEVDALSAYYAQLRQRQTEEDEEEEEEDEEDEDDDDEDDEFEAFEVAEAEADAEAAAAAEEDAAEAEAKAKDTAKEDAKADPKATDTDDDIDEAIFEEMDMSDAE